MSSCNYRYEVSIALYYVYVLTSSKPLNFKKDLRSPGMILFNLNRSAFANNPKPQNPKTPCLYFILAVKTEKDKNICPLLFDNSLHLANINQEIDY